MIRFGIIGTSWISAEFASVCKLIPEVELTAVYSRNDESGKKFAEENNILDVFTDYDVMLQGDYIDAVYIASPNAMHFQQALLALNAKKHVICEKAITSNLKELNVLIEAANANNVILLEAVKCLAMPTYHRLKENLVKIGPIRKVFFNFCQYSSKYNAYLDGEVPNIFNPVFSAGALMDIGIYCIYPCIDLFGMPKGIKSQVNKLRTGVDGSGSILMNYEGFGAVMMYSKINASLLPSEIMGENGSILIDHISKPMEITLNLTGQEPIQIGFETEYEPMYYEVKEFVDAIMQNRLNVHYYNHALSQNVMHILDSIRQANHIVFPADNF
ncbi:MAG: Gfo/Idh/MocA family protein [Cellulosilyticaceae bacterium]